MLCVARQDPMLIPSGASVRSVGPSPTDTTGSPMYEGRSIPVGRSTTGPLAAVTPGAPAPVSPALPGLRTTSAIAVSEQEDLIGAVVPLDRHVAARWSEGQAGDRIEVCDQARCGRVSRIREPHEAFHLCAGHRVQHDVGGVDLA